MNVNLKRKLDCKFEQNNFMYYVLVDINNNFFYTAKEKWHEKWSNELSDARLYNTHAAAKGLATKFYNDYDTECQIIGLECTGYYLPEQIEEIEDTQKMFMGCLRG